MTLGGLALAVGILVDEATVAIENIHTHLARGVPVARGVLDASGEVVVPRLLAMLSVVAVFVPVLLHDGRVAIAVRAALARGRLLDDRVVLAVEFARAGAVGLAARQASRGARPATRTATDWVDRLRNRLGRLLQRLAPARWLLVVGVRGGHRRGRRSWSASRSGREIFPAGGVSQFQLRFRAPAGTKFESTERLATDVLDEIKQAAGPDNVEITLGYVGVQPSSYPINTIFLWTGGSHEGVLQVALKPEAGIRLDRLRGDAARAFQRALSDRAVLVRAGRHRQPDHELRHVDAGRGGDHRTGLRRQPDVRGQGAGRARRGFPRFAICSTARRSTIRRFRST